jgi:chromosome segregation ATPase
LFTNEIIHVGSGAFDNLKSLKSLDVTGNKCINENFRDDRTKVVRLIRHIQIKCKDQDFLKSLIPTSTSTTTPESITTENPKVLELQKNVHQLSENLRTTSNVNKIKEGELTKLKEETLKVKNESSQIKNENDKLKNKINELEKENIQLKIQNQENAKNEDKFEVFKSAIELQTFAMFSSFQALMEQQNSELALKIESLSAKITENNNKKYNDVNQMITELKSNMDGLKSQEHSNFENLSKNLQNFELKNNEKLENIRSELGEKVENLCKKEKPDTSAY